MPSTTTNQPVEGASSGAPVAEVPPAVASRSRRAKLVSLVIVAAALLAATWFVGGRAGFGEIGRGGQNLKLLPRVGEPAPDVTVALSDGRLVNLSDFRGQPVWINFWGSWCPPCRAEMPDMVAAYKELQPRGLVLLAISLDESMAEAASYAERNGATFLIAADPRRIATGREYPIANFPTHILIDRDGIVRDVVLSSLTKETIIERANAILAPDSGD